MADLFLSQHGNKHVSERWVYRFVDRHPEVKLRFSRRYNYERAKCEDIKLIPLDGLCPHTLSSKQQPFINKAGLRLFHKIGDLILVKMAGQQMRLEYDGFKNTLFLLRQAPLDVNCFAVLKRQYGRLVEQRVRLGFNHIDKYDFLTAFPEARTMAYKAENIQNGFKATELVPFDPDRVYQKLTVELRTPTPPPSRSSNSQSSCQQTPQNPRQFNRQTATIKKINEPTTGPFEVVDQAINRLSKAYEMSRNELLIIQKEVHDLRAANEKEKQKRKRSRAQISHQGSLTAQEAQELITSRECVFGGNWPARCPITLVHWLLEKGADVNTQGGEFGNALQAAVEGGRLEIVERLLEKGADVNAQGGLYGNALQVAVEGGHLKIVQRLLENGADVNAQGGYYSNALQTAFAES
ncbi:ankyrin repeat-containing protein, putative [Talaromyces stipitatus ATCC 10500]|uniref:Ankyrin repeat-containing protein, putative n=1 Tax=Talaromyces stipitatus (strain ATCC 10500 / CBS 375.48 / QM 6759 / NRRL 1006) TaxID=441959 RepID=B8MI46_TALSN|nr:ankyrin repeat-containing protein, putative [Talaromyces stipitatus ATCC 10500]EED17208.1 ankyrin repeat-containing protein, putative [Talaromyces stipitatus ATCC 10500]